MDKLLEEPPTISKRYIYSIQLDTGETINLDIVIVWTDNPHCDYTPYLEERLLKCQRRLATGGFSYNNVYYAPAGIRRITFKEKENGV